MYRHISIFTLENANQIPEFIQQLEQIAKLPSVVSAQSGVNLTQIPENVSCPDFGDVIQILDFETKEELDAYPSSDAHQDLLKNGPEMKKVTAIDYEF